MIPFGPGEIPASSSEAAQRIENTIAAMIADKKGRRPEVQCELGNPGEINRLSVDISNLESAATEARKPGSFSRLGAGIMRNFAVVGHPLIIYGAPVDLQIQGQNMPVEWVRDDRGELWLMPSQNGVAGESSPDGFAEISVPAARFEDAVRAALTAAAEANGARLKDMRLRIESAGPRSVVVAVDVAASKFMMTARLRAVADAALDQNMNLRVNNVEVTGDGAAGSMVANMIAGRLGEWRGRVIPLSQYMFAGAALRDVQIETGDTLRLRASFGQ